MQVRKKTLIICFFDQSKRPKASMVFASVPLGTHLCPANTQRLSRIAAVVYFTYFVCASTILSPTDSIPVQERPLVFII